MSDVFRTLAVVCILVIAGCNAPASQPATEPGAETVTPAPVPNTTATARDREFAPGVDGGVTDPSRLARAHAATLDSTSYTVNQTLVQRYDNGTLRSRYVTIAKFGTEPGRFLATTYQADRENGTLVARQTRRFGDGERAYVAEEDGNRTSYRLIRYPDGEPRNPSDVYLRNLTNAAAVERLFTLLETEIVAAFVENGTRYVRVQSVEPTTVPPLRNVTIAAVISDRGIVNSYQIEYDVTRDGEIAASVAVNYTDIGSTTVERPAWVDRVNATRDS